MSTLELPPATTRDNDHFVSTEPFDPGSAAQLSPDQERLYLGTDLGVMVSLDAGQTWMTEETGFGPAVTMWLALIRTPAGQKQLFAFTHGRGVWRVTLR